jgi:hypothetical protein
MAGPKCIANNGSNGQPEVPLWLCPCHTCTRMDWEIRYEEEQSLREFREEMFPEHYPPR